MEIGPNLTNIIVQLITLVGIVVTAVFSWLNKRKADTIETKVQAVADGMQSRMMDAKDTASMGLGAARQVEIERASERIRTAARAEIAADAARAAGVEQGLATGRAQHDQSFPAPDVRPQSGQRRKVPK